MQDCSNSRVLAMDLLQSCTKPSTWCLQIVKCSRKLYSNCPCTVVSKLPDIKLFENCLAMPIAKENLVAVSISRCHLTSIGIPMLKIRRSHDRLIFNMGIPIPGKTVFILRQGPDPAISCEAALPDNAMVTYSLWRVCHGGTATLFPQTVRRPYSFYANYMTTSRF